MVFELINCFFFLQRDLSHSDLTVRRAALCCLRQLSQKEAAEVSKYALMAKGHVPAKPYCGKCTINL